MIALLTGTLTEKYPDHCIVDVGGVGYRVDIPVSTFTKLPELNTTVALHIHTHVREDQLALFGFLNAHDRTLFQRLIAVAGVGPKTAQSILSGIPSEDLVSAIGREDAARLTTIPGVGRKTAERIIVDLKDKLATLTTTLQVHPVSSEYQDACHALVNLGYTRDVAERALKKVTASDTPALPDMIRRALKELAQL
ncbi:MAG: Holliday junction branch migration protein RuvA [Deltaproteobacteria bacterium]|nr:Holliday junction branch migration protein RuvA [Deltaproteobacteria bacterium]